MCCRFTFVENNIRNLLKVPRTTFLGSDGLFYFISICKFDSFWNPFKTITNFSELYFSFWRFIPLVQTKKKWILWNLVAAQTEDEWGLTWYLQWGNIHPSNLSPLTKFTSSSTSMQFKHILPWNISQMITKTIPISTRTVISYSMKQGSVLSLMESE